MGALEKGLLVFSILSFSKWGLHLLNLFLYHQCAGGTQSDIYLEHMAWPLVRSKLPGDKDLGPFSISKSPKNPEHRMTHSRCPINICCMNESMDQ